MTYAEFIERVPNLPRIWQPAWHWSEGLSTAHSPSHQYWRGRVSVTKNWLIDFDITDYFEDNIVSFGMRVHNASNRLGYIGTTLDFGPDGTTPEPYTRGTYCEIGDGVDFETDDIESAQIWSQFTTQWIPYFRRGCWLTGLPIECTAHEQLDWTMWLEQRDQDWAMWTVEAAARKAAQPRGFSIGPFSDIIVESPMLQTAFAKWRKRGKNTA